jgi:hypothetical protein
MSPGAQNSKTGPDDLGTAEYESTVQNMKMRPDALGTAENEFGSAKYENGTRRPRYRRKRVRERKTLKRDPTASVPPKMSSGAQNMKTVQDTFGTVEKESKSSQHEKGTRRPRYPLKTSPGAQNMKYGPDDLGTAENEFDSENMKTGHDALGTVGKESGIAEHENGTRRPRYRRKRVWERKT